MKSALCLSGLVGGIRNKNGKGTVIDYTYCSKNLHRNIIDVNKSDVFFHTWSVEYANDLQDLYNPKLMKAERQKTDFPIDDEYLNDKILFRVYSKWYSIKESMRLLEEYEKKCNIRYDWVMLGRFDLLVYSTIDFGKLENGCVYVSAMCWDRGKTRAAWELAEGKDTSISRKLLLDLFFIADRETMSKFLSPEWKYYSKNIHSLWFARVCKIFGDSNCIRFIGLHGYHNDLYRWKIRREILT